MSESKFLSHTEAAIQNRNLILTYIKQNNLISRTKIWKDLNLSRASVTLIMKQLIDSKFVLEIGEGESSGGRKPQLVKFNPDVKQLYVFDWSSKWICLANLGGDIIYKEKLIFPSGCTPEQLCDLITQRVEEINKTKKVDPDNLLAFGISLPGLIQPDAGMVIYSAELNWRNVNIVAMLKKSLNMNVFLEQTGNMFALGEYYYGNKNNKGSNHFLNMIIRRQGFGSSVIVNSKPQHGSNYMMAEVGHIKLPSDVVCSCGQQGCLEAIIKDLLHKNKGIIDDLVLEYIAIGISTAITLFDPKIAVLSGDLIEQMRPEELAKLSDKVRSMVVNGKARDLSIEVSTLGEFAGVKGMVGHIYDACFSQTEQ